MDIGSGKSSSMLSSGQLSNNCRAQTSICPMSRRAHCKRAKMVLLQLSCQVPHSRRVRMKYLKLVIRGSIVIDHVRKAAGQHLASDLDMPPSPVVQVRITSDEYDDDCDQC